MLVIAFATPDAVRRMQVSNRSQILILHRQNAVSDIPRYDDQIGLESIGPPNQFSDMGFGEQRRGVDVRKLDDGKTVEAVREMPATAFSTVRTTLRKSRSPSTKNTMFAGR